MLGSCAVARVFERTASSFDRLVQVVAFKSGSILEGPGRIQDDSAPFGERLGNGNTFQTVREYLSVVERNVYNLVAAGAVVQPQTQLLLEILRERGDEMDVDRMKSFILRLGDELSAAQQAAGITSEDFQQIEAECATAAGRAAVERRVEAAEKVMFQAMQLANEKRVEPVVPKMNKRLRKEKRRHKEATLVAAVGSAAVEAVAVRAATVEAVDIDGVVTATEQVHVGGTHLVDQNVLGTALAAVMADVVRMEEVETSPVPMCGVFGAAAESMQQCGDTCIQLVQTM